MIDDGHPIADPLHLGQQMGVEDDRRAPIAERTDDSADVLTPDRIERRGRLVENDKIGSTEQSHRQTEALLHSFREGLRSTVRSIDQPDQLQSVPDLGLPFGPRQASQLAMQREDFARGHPALVSEQLGQIADAPPRGNIAERRPHDASIPRRRP